jgi:hypothetical protein
MTAKRRRFKQTDSLEVRLLQFAKDMRRKADKAPDGDERKALLQRASNADQAIDLERQLRHAV